MLHVLRILSCGYLVEKSENRVLFGGSELLVGELLSLKRLNVLSITLQGFSAVQKLMSSQKFQSCTKCLELIDCDDSKSFALAELKHLEKLVFRIVEEFKFCCVEVGKAQECFRLNSFHRVNIKACHKLRDVTWLVFAPNLMVIQIEKCMQMEAIISARKLGEIPEMMADLNPFAKLQYLRFRVLPKLKIVYWNESPFPHVREIIVSECPILKKLSLNFNNAKESKIVIKGEEHWWNELQREDEATVNAFLPYFGSI
ncbi:hypothetical protein KPL70_020788 [Citrus sinensis]|uniref:FBD domain-containing protein n=1 Tax=Citrus clementina TaxID=85681 RepID=V4SIV7_CITCL|nr:hypothetical protein CICLE_v10027540mg [Citrus x clementina]KAH9666798.1 hypothetical protein KPL70_020788 [Citrus sinensis]